LKLKEENKTKGKGDQDMANENVERRSFEGPDGSFYFVASPAAEDIRAADWQYSKTYTNSLVEGITTSAEMQDILMRRGIIGPEFEARAHELALTLNERITDLDNAITNEEKRNFSIAVAQAREELFQWNQRLSGPMSNTCEQLADDARLECLTSRIVVDKDGKKVWNSFDSYLTEKNNQLAMRARFEVMLFLQGLDSDFLDRTPEAMAMKEVEEDVISKAREAMRMVEATAREEEKAIEDSIVSAEKNQEDSKPTKKKTSKK
jgi:hypothetical protein